MATSQTGWLCSHGAKIVSETSTTAVVEVTNYWQNNGWTYNVSNIYGYVYLGNSSATVLNNGSVNSTKVSASGGKVAIGSYQFTVSKTAEQQTITCYAKINSNSNYAGDQTLESTKTTITIPALPKYTIVYDANGGEGQMEDTVVTYTISTPIRKNTYTRVGYNFLGWHAYKHSDQKWYWDTGWAAEGSQASGSVKYLYSDEEVVARTSWVDGDTVTFYAVWQIKVYTVTYNSLGGDVTPTKQSKTHDVAITLSGVVPSKVGYTFEGWSTSENATSADYEPNQTFNENGDTVLYAVWLPNGVMYFRNGSKWSIGRVWINSNGVYKTGIVWTNVNGTWKRGGIN